MLGFFILEDHVLNTGGTLITKAFLEDMWSMALTKIVTALQTHSVSKKKKCRCKIFYNNKLLPLFVGS